MAFAFCGVGKSAVVNLADFARRCFLTDNFTVVSQAHLIEEKTKTLSNRVDQNRLEYPIISAQRALAARSSILMDGHLEDSWTEKQAHREIEKEFSKGCLCTYIVFTIACAGR
jgi:hypothetical protein